MAALNRSPQDNPEHKREFLEALGFELPLYIARSDVERLLGGIVTGKTLANADARGNGPEVAYVVGRKVVYTRAALLDWLAANFTVVRLANVRKAV